MRQVDVSVDITGSTRVCIGGVCEVWPRRLSSWTAYRGQSLDGLLPLARAWGRIGPRLYRAYAREFARAIRQEE